MIRAGQLCRGCTGGCCELPGTSPGVLGIEVTCPVCNGAGCPHCQGGSYELTECPHDYIRPVTETLIYLDAFLDGNGTPIPGGLLDQSAWFLHTARWWKNEDARVSNG